jgi:hypothetical protein
MSDEGLAGARAATNGAAALMVEPSEHDARASGQAPKREIRAHAHVSVLTPDLLAATSGANPF